MKSDSLYGDELLIAALAQAQPRSFFRCDEGLQSKINLELYKLSKRREFKRLFAGYPFDTDGHEPYSAEVTQGVDALLHTRLLERHEVYEISPAVRERFETSIKPKVSADPVVAKLGALLLKALGVKPPENGKGDGDAKAKKGEASKELPCICSLYRLCWYFKGIWPLELVVEAARAWVEPHRYYHTLDNHLLPMLAGLDRLLSTISRKDFPRGFTKNEMRRHWFVAALYHDICYGPKSDLNEEYSLKKFHEDFRALHNAYARMYSHKELISWCIACTKENLEAFKWGKPFAGSKPKIRGDFKNAAMLFRDIDRSRLLHGSTQRLIQDGKLLRQEFKHLSDRTFYSGTIQFLQSYRNLNPNIESYIAWLNRQLAKAG